MHSCPSFDKLINKIAHIASSNFVRTLVLKMNQKKKRSPTPLAAINIMIVLLILIARNIKTVVFLKSKSNIKKF